jgi:hypothetical protein
MIIRNFYMTGTGGLRRPLETDPPLVVDADAVLPGAVTLQGFEAVARQGTQIAQAYRGGQDFEPFVCLTVNARERWHSLASGELGRSLIPEACDHALGLTAFTHDVKHNRMLAMT